MTRAVASSEVVHAAPADIIAGAEVATKARVAKLTFGAAESLLLLALLAAPWAFGAVQVWAWATLAVLAFASLLLWTISQVVGGMLRIAWTPLYIPAALFLTLGLVQYYGHLTFDPVGTREALIKFSTDLVFFFLVCQFMARAGEKVWRGLGLLVTLYAFALAMFAILQFFSSHGLLYWVIHTHGYVFGPYVNHNDYAGLMEMLIPIGGAYVLSRREGGSRAGLLAFMVLVPIVSVLLSGSRGGMIALLIEAIIAAAVLRVSGADRGTKGRALGAVGLAAALLLFLWVAPRWVTKRLETAAGVVHSPEITLGDRLTMGHDSLRLWRDHLAMGSGLGSFAIAYSPYQSFPTDLFWDHAHDDYVEALAETGAVGGVLIVAALVFFFRPAFADLSNRLRNPSGWIQLGATIGVCGLLVHSFVDFNLHIPANAAWFVVCAAVASRFEGATSEPGLLLERR